MTNGRPDSARGSRVPSSFSDEFKCERSQADTAASHETARAATQAATLINGGAAAAILTFLSKQTLPPLDVIRAASISLIIYAFGMASGGFSTWCSSQSAAQYALMWEARITADSAYERQRLSWGNFWVGLHRVFLFLSLGCFVAASFWVGRAFLRSL
jgi:hypothetical protein